MAVDLPGKIPNEVFDRIFALLAPDRRDIARCRLVSRWFRRLSSPYLIPRVVFALRLKTLAHLRQVIDHTYFRQHVTELFVDASQYDEDIAADWEAYIDACKDSFQTFNDPEYQQRRAEDLDGWTEVGKLLSTPDERIAPAHGSGSSVSKEEKAKRSSIDLVRSGYDEDAEHDDGEASEIPADDLSSWDSEDSETFAGQPAGWYRSYPDYKMRYAAQRKLDKNNTIHDLLDVILSRLPKLQRIIFGDWRDLAYGTEPYTACARRLFGNTLAPTPCGAGRLEMNLFLALARSAVRTGKLFKEFSVSSHPFETRTGLLHRNLTSLPYEMLDRREWWNLMAVPTLRRLHVIIMLTEAELASFSPERAPGTVMEKDQMHESLAIASDLRQLTLGLQVDRFGISATPEDETCQPTIFQNWLRDQYWPRLEFLALRGWILSQAPLEAFLSRHASSLRSVKLVDCRLLGDPLALARWAATHLTLEAIEISRRNLPPAPRALEFGEPPPPFNAVAFNPKHEHLWLARR